MTVLTDARPRPRSVHFERASLAALGRLTLAALVGIAIVLIDAQPILLKRFDPDLTTLALLTLGVTVLVAAGWRWAPLIGAVWAVVLGALWSTLAVSGNAGGVAHALAHPDDPLRFDFAVIAVALALVSFGSGVAATVQNYRSVVGRRPAPGWLAGSLSALAGVCLGAIVVAGIPRTSLGAGVRPETLASLPALGTERLRFDRIEVRTRVGDTVALRLENRDGFAHSFDIDELDVHAPMPGSQSALALFRPMQPGTYTFYCAVPGHRAAGMVGTLIIDS